MSETGRNLLIGTHLVGRFKPITNKFGQIFDRRHIDLLNLPSFLLKSGSSAKQVFRETFQPHFIAVTEQSISFFIRNDSRERRGPSDDQGLPNLIIIEVARLFVRLNEYI